jgi:hypothetical protein
VDLKYLVGVSLTSKTCHKEFEMANLPSDPDRQRKNLNGISWIDW